MCWRIFLLDAQRYEVLESDYWVIFIGASWDKVSELWGTKKTAINCVYVVFVRTWRTEQSFHLLAKKQVSFSKLMYNQFSFQSCFSRLPD